MREILIAMCWCLVWESFCQDLEQVRATPAEEQLCQLRGAKMTFFTTGQGAGLFGLVQVCLWKERENFITLDHMKGA